MFIALPKLTRSQTAKYIFIRPETITGFEATTGTVQGKDVPAVLVRTAKGDFTALVNKAEFIKLMGEVKPMELSAEAAAAYTVELPTIE